MKNVKLTKARIVQIARISLIVGTISILAIIIYNIIPDKWLIMVPFEKVSTLKITLSILVASVITSLIVVNKNPKDFFQGKESAIVISIIVLITMIFCGITA